MEVKKLFSTSAKVGLNRCFLDIHVEGVKLQTKIIRTDLLNRVEPLSSIIDQSGFVAVDWLQRQSAAM